MKKILLIILCFTTLSTFAKMTKEQKALAVIDVSREVVKSDIKAMVSKLKKFVAEEIIYPSQFMAMSSRLQEFSLHPFIEGEAGYKRSWFKTLATTAKGIVKAQTKMNIANLEHNKTELSKNRELFNKLVNQFIKIAKNPEKVNKRRRKELQKRFRPIKRKLIAQRDARLAKEAAKRKAQERAEKKKKRRRKKKSE